MKVYYTNADRRASGQADIHDYVCLGFNIDQEYLYFSRSLNVLKAIHFRDRCKRIQRS